jgi:hypothetical protein
MFEIYWEQLSKVTFSEEMYFILRKWNQNEVDVFAFLVQENLNRLSVNPFIGKPIKSYYKLVISKQTTLYYKVIENKKQIHLLVFWNNLKNPDDLAKLLL